MINNRRHCEISDFFPFSPSTSTNTGRFFIVRQIHHAYLPDPLQGRESYQRRVETRTSPPKTNRILYNILLLLLLLMYFILIDGDNIFISAHYVPAAGFSKMFNHHNGRTKKGSFEFVSPSFGIVYSVHNMNKSFVSADCVRKTEITPQTVA